MVLFGPAIPFRHAPLNILVKHLDAAGLAMKAILRINLQFLLPILVSNELIDFRWTKSQSKIVYLYSGAS